MSDVRARLTDALLEHPSTEDGCRCGDEHLAYDYWARHVADVLLSLPGLAIVELPKPRRSGAWTIFATADPYIASSCERQVDDRDQFITPSEARRRAAALLAAANAAEQAT
jgi:hypothetical protein